MTNATTTDGHQYFAWLDSVARIWPPTDAPTAAECEVHGLELKRLFREDSRPGSWCARIARTGGRGVYHMSFDPHSMRRFARTASGPRESQLADTVDNTDALEIIAGWVRDR